MNQNEQVVKSESRLKINLTLLGITFTVFALIISINPSLFTHSLLVPLQLTMAIPFLFTSALSRSKLGYTNKPKLWDNYGFLTFTAGYVFLVNTIGILLAASISLIVGLVFLLANMFIAIFYSTLDVIETKSKLGIRMRKDILFIMLVLLGGILPVLGVY